MQVLDVLERTLRQTVAIRSGLLGENTPDQWATANLAAILLKRVTHPFVWSGGATRAIVEAATLAQATDPRFPADPGLLMPEGEDTVWWSFDPPIAYAPEPVSPDADPTYQHLMGHLAALVFSATAMPDPYEPTVEKEGYHIVLFRPVVREGKPLRLMGGAFVVAPPGGRCNDPRLSEQGQAVLRLVVAGCDFLRTRVEVTRHPVERHRRKQIARAIKDGPMIAEVRHVTLRRPEVTPHEEPAAAGYEDHRTYRYLVPETEAWRACGPGRTERRRVKVKPHINGPKGRPLRIAPLVYEVKR